MYPCPFVTTVTLVSPPASVAKGNPAYWLMRAMTPSCVLSPLRNVTTKFAPASAPRVTVSAGLMLAKVAPELVTVGAVPVKVAVCGPAPTSSPTTCPLVSLYVSAATFPCTKACLVSCTLPTLVFTRQRSSRLNCLPFSCTNALPFQYSGVPAPSALRAMAQQFCACTPPYV